MHTRVIAGLALAVVVLSAGSCGGDEKPPTEPPADTTAPTVAIVFPITPDPDSADTEYDETGDALLDLRVEWSDDDSGVDPSTATLTVLEGVNGSAPGDDLLGVWTVVRQDEAGLESDETLDALMHPEWSRLVVSVADTAGNEGADTLRVHLPYGALHHSIETNLSDAFATGITLCSDDSRVYMTPDRLLVVADATSLELIDVIDPPKGFSFTDPVCVEGTPDLYTAGIAVVHYDRVDLAWLEEVDGSTATSSLIRSRANPDLLFSGESFGGAIGVIDIAVGERVRMLAPWSDPDEFIFAMAALAGDAKLYATRSQQGGVLVIDPSTGAELAVTDVSQGSSLGTANDLALSSDDEFLYAAVLNGIPTGVVEIDTQTDQVVRTLDLAPWRAVAVALNPSGTRMFVTTQDPAPAIPADNVLVDVPNWRVLETFPRPHPSGEIRFDQAAVFHPNGRLVFVARDSDIDVYLNRE